jgi:hypothetical protein
MFSWKIFLKNWFDTMISLREDYHRKKKRMADLENRKWIYHCHPNQFEKGICYWHWRRFSENDWDSTANWKTDEPTIILNGKFYRKSELTDKVFGELEPDDYAKASDFIENWNKFLFSFIVTSMIGSYF